MGHIPHWSWKGFFLHLKYESGCYYCWWFRNPANQLRLVVYPIIYRVLYIQGGAGFLPSTVGVPNITFSKKLNMLSLHLRKEFASNVLSPFNVANHSSFKTLQKKTKEKKTKKKYIPKHLIIWHWFIFQRPVEHTLDFLHRLTAWRQDSLMETISTSDWNVPFPLSTGKRLTSKFASEEQWR